MIAVTELVVSDEEQVARIISREWMTDGILLPIAFAFRQNETYLSVNRLCIDSYNKDVKWFVDSHENFQTSSDDSYYRALLNVGDVRSIKVTNEGEPLELTVEVEPRDFRLKSHAGIFTRVSGKNLKVGDLLVSSTLKKGISADVILLAVRSRLLDMARLETLTL